MSDVRSLRSRVMRLPVVRRLRCVDLRRVRPLGDGRQQGLPIVRYRAQFLEQHRVDIRGED